MKYPPLIARYASIAAIGVLMTACGGGGGATATDTTATPTTVAAASISGSLIDGPIQGAQVFVDLNNDKTRTSDEPISSLTNAAGEFSIDVSALTPAELASATLVSIVPDSALDADDEGKTLLEAGRVGMTFISPLSAYITSSTQTSAQGAVVSPITTLVAASLDDGLKLEQARTRVAQELSLGDVDPMDNYVKKGHTDIGKIARATADIMGEARKILDQSLTTSSETMDESDVLPVVIGAVRDQMAKAMSDSNTRATIVGQTTKLTPSEVKTLIDAAASDPDVATAANAIAETMEEALGRRGGSKRRPSELAAQTYIVIFSPNKVAPSAVSQTASDHIPAAHRGAATVKTFETVFQGFSVTLPAAASDAFLNAILKNPNVRSVEVEQSLQRRATTRAVVGSYNGSSYNLWNLDIADGTPNGFYTYTKTGAETTAFVIDTGILSSHDEFTTSRVGTGFNALTGTSDATDDQGHGTHVAGSIGGITFGISSGVTLVPVKVLAADGSGSLTSVIAGMDWVAQQVADNNLAGRAVVNMSLGGGASSALDYAAANLVSRGIPVVVAAGNSNADACNYSPAREPSVITVGAASFGSNQYTRAYYSNFGSCVDLFAPGSSISSASSSGTSLMATMSGTSMAAPHVAGWVAQLLELSAEAGNVATADSDYSSWVNEWVIKGSSSGRLQDAGTGSPNLFMTVSSTLPSTTTGGGSGSTDTPAAVDVHVADIQGRSGKAGKNWAAQATVTVVNSSAVAVSGATVQGKFTISGLPYSVQCTTADNGSCTVGISALPTTITSVSYAPVGITPDTSFTYIAGDNAVSSVTISAPASTGGSGKSTREGKPDHVKR